MKQAESKQIAIQSVGGLEIETEVRLRSPNSWRRLDNWDLQVPGSIQKVRGLAAFGAFQYDSQIVAIREYRRRPGEAKRLLGLSVQGTLYDLMTGDPISQFPVVNFPFVGEMSGYADGESVDVGQNPAIQVQYLISTTAGFYPAKWDGADGMVATTIGVSAPTECPTVRMLICAGPEDLVGGTAYSYIYVQVSRHYAWTWWNPTTKHESSLSPIGEECIVDQERFPFLGDFPRIRQIRVSLPTAAPLRGDGYTRKRLYATRDGGTEFFLITGLTGMDVDGSVPLAQDSILDGSFDPAVITISQSFLGTGYIVLTGITGINGIIPHGAPQPRQAWAVGFIDAANEQYWVSDGETTSHAVLNHLRGELMQSLEETVIPIEGDADVSTTIDDVLIEPSPLVGEHDPPPPATWGAIYQGRLWLLDAENESRLWFSKINDFQSFPSDNFFLLESDDFDPITALYSNYTSLIVGKHRSINIITGTSFADFTNLPLDPQIGFLGKRCVVSVEGRLFFYSEQGLMRLESNQPSFDGHLIRPKTDILSRTEAAERLCGAVDMRHGILLMAYRANGNDASDSLILYDLSQQSPFSFVPLMGCTVWSMQECLVPGEQYSSVLIGTGDCKIHRVFSGFDDLAGLPIKAYAETQKLPQEDLSSRKVFRRLLIETPFDAYLNNLRYQWSIDDGPFQPPGDLLNGIEAGLPLQKNNFLGVVGKQIVLRFFHEEETANAVITNFVIEYVDIGESR